MFRPAIALLALLLLATACGGGTTPSSAASAADSTQSSAASPDTEPSEVAEASVEPSAAEATACDLVPGEVAGYTLNAAGDREVTTPDSLEAEAEATEDQVLADQLRQRATFWNTMGIIESCQRSYDAEGARIIVAATRFMNEQGPEQYYASEWSQGCQPVVQDFPAAPDAQLYDCPGLLPAAYAVAVVVDGTTGWEIISRLDYPTGGTMTDEMRAEMLADAFVAAGTVAEVIQGDG
ncbi:MAG TPA: hypothetical protein VHK28_06095 [Candidatus Limnocylindria bacterium]|nr:hypothetical protein [Candidatus Limnocylindria bacterium]